MPDAMEIILSRRSIRKFTEEPVSEEAITALMRAAMAAPSAINEQAWQFIVVRKRELLERIPQAHLYTPLPHAPLAIIVCGDLRAQIEKGWWVQDCSAASQNILLAAHAMGLGAVWCGVYPVESRVKGLQDIFGIPDYIIPMALIVLGHPEHPKRPSNRYDPAKVHFDRW